MELARPSLRRKLSQLQRCSMKNIYGIFNIIYGVFEIIYGIFNLYDIENSQRFFDKFEKSEDGSINQEEFMKALAEERNLVDILTQNGRCYQGIDL